MPELPEVEVVVRSLRPYLLGKEIVKLERWREKSLPQNLVEAEGRSLGAKVIGVTRRAKFIDIILENGMHILTHLKMTGQLIYAGESEEQTAGGGHPTSDWRAQLPGKHTRLTWTLLDEKGKRSHLYFNDQRVFGWMQVLSESEVAEKYYQKLGPDANTAEFTSEYLAGKLTKKRIPIKVAIMDNEIVCGLGNIYAAEACFGAGIDPRRAANSLSENELQKIVTEAKKVLALAIEEGGTTFDGKYVDADGQSGRMVEKLQVYGRAGQLCYKCGATLELIKLGGRATVFCPGCQK